MNLGEFIDTFRDAIAQRVVESYPPLYRPRIRCGAGFRRTAGRSPACSESPWGRRPTPSGARPYRSKPTGARRSSARWARGKPLVRRVTRHRIPGSVGENSEKVLGPTDPPQSESLGSGIGDLVFQSVDLGPALVLLEHRVVRNLPLVAALSTAALHVVVLAHFFRPERIRDNFRPCRASHAPYWAGPIRRILSRSGGHSPRLSQLLVIM